MWALFFAPKTEYRIGQIGDAHQQLMLVTIDYQQAHINGERSLMIETEEGRTSFGLITLKVPETKGKYENIYLAAQPTK